MLGFYTGQQILDEIQRCLPLAHFSPTPCHKWALSTEVQLGAMLLFTLLLPLWGQEVNLGSQENKYKLVNVFEEQFWHWKYASCCQRSCLPFLSLCSEFAGHKIQQVWKTCYHGVGRVFVEQAGSWAPTTLMTHSISPQLKWLVGHMLVLGYGTKWLKGSHREEITSL